jgi:hypothetical protein
VNWPLAIGLAAAWIVGPPLVIVALTGRRSLKASHDLRNDQSEPLGIGGGADFFEHDQLATERERYNRG